MTTKFCSRCEKTKPLTDFNRNKTSRDGVQTYCRECQRTHDKENYAKSAKRRKQIADRRKVNATQRNATQARDEAQAYIAAYLKSHPCVDCGETNIITLQFDHVRGEKLNNVSNLMGGGYTLNAIKQEVAKCVVRCANCHSIKTAIERDFRTLRILEELLNE